MTKPDNLFWVELIEDTRRRRSLALKFALPIALVLPLTLEHISSTVRHSGLPLIVLFLGVLGSSVGLSGLRERGILERLSALPLSRMQMIRDYLMANFLMDALQVLTPAVVLGLALRLDAGAVFLTIVGLVLCLLLANALGVLMAVLSGSSSEVHLYSAMCVLGVAGLSGLFFTHDSGIMNAVSEGLPFGLLKDGLAGCSLNEKIADFLVSGSVTLLATIVAIAGSSRLFRNKGASS